MWNFVRKVCSKNTWKVGIDIMYITVTNSNGGFCKVEICIKQQGHAILAADHIIVFELSCKNRHTHTRNIFNMQSFWIRVKNKKKRAGKVIRNTPWKHFVLNVVPYRYMKLSEV